MSLSLLVFTLLFLKSTQKILHGPVQNDRKLHTCFQLVPKSMTTDDLEWPLATLFHNKVFFGANHKNFNQGRPEL